MRRRRPDRRATTTRGASAMLRPRRNWTRGVAAQHASLSRWRSPVRIRSGPPSLAFPYAPSARPDGAFLCPAIGASDRVEEERGEQALNAYRRPSGTIRRWTAGSGWPLRGSSSWPCSRSDRSGCSAASPSPSADAEPSVRPSSGSRRRRRSPRRGPGACPSAVADVDAIEPPVAIGADSADVPIVPVTNFRATPTSTDLTEVKAVLAGTSNRYKARRAHLGRGRRDPGGPRRRPADRRLAADPRRQRGGARGGPHEERQATGLPARRRGRARGSRARLGRRGAVRRRPGQGPCRLAADRAAARCRGRHRLRPQDDLDAVRGRRHHARPRRVRDPPRQGQGRRLPVRRRDGRHHRPLQGLLAARLGPAVHEADRQRRDVPRPHQGRRHRHRQLREPGARTIRSGTPRGPSSRPTHVSSTGWPRAGIDYVSLANNHIRDAGASGLLQTITNVKKRGIAVSGAGRNLAAARVPAILTAAGTKVAILGYDAIAGGYHATATKVGSAPLSAALVKQDVAAARKAGADVVIVFPHWGTEYDPTPFVNQTRPGAHDHRLGRRHGHRQPRPLGRRDGALQGQADLVCARQLRVRPDLVRADHGGHHPRADVPGHELVQVRMRPHIILDKAQPNFLDPAGDGRVVMGQVFTRIEGLAALVRPSPRGRP